MQLTLTSQAGLPGQPETTLAVDGDVLIIDGIAHDLSPISEGDEGEWPDSPITGPIRRISGVLHATVLIRLGDDAADDQPDSPWQVSVASGAVVIPAARQPREVAE